MIGVNILFTIGQNQEYVYFILNLIVIAFAIIMSSFFEKDSIYFKIIIGFVFGFLSIVLMNIPVRLPNGTFYDAKSILFSISGYFFGFIPTTISLAMGIIFRAFFVDGAGNPWVNISTMLNSGIVAYLAGKVFKKYNIRHNFIGNIIIVFGINIINLILFLNLSWFDTNFTDLIIPYLIAFPLFTILAAYLLNKYISYNKLVSENFYQKRLLKHSVDVTNKLGIVTLDKNLRYVLFNKTYEKYTEDLFNVKVHVGDYFFDTYKNFDKYLDTVKVKIENALKGKRIFLSTTFEIDGHKYYYDEEFIPVYDKNKIIAVNILINDITNQKLYEEEMINLSYRDPLTGLYNRRSLAAKINELSKEESITVIYFDVDGLKFMNDAFGHADGDKLILTIVNEIRDKLSINSLVFRLGGDEFVALVQDSCEREGNQIAKQIVKNLSKQKINEIGISLSYGVATKDQNEQLESTIIRAEENMYDNKILFSRTNNNKNIETLLNTLFNIDPKLKDHIENVKYYSVKMAEKLELDEYTINWLKQYVLVHDIGKINIDKELMLKPIENEFHKNKVRSHVETGYRILSRIPEFFEIAFDVLSQYENYDGTGFPKGLSGNNIPLKARILRITNYYDFMIRYQGLEKENVLNRIMNGKGTLFDPELVDIFFELLE